MNNNVPGPKQPPRLHGDGCICGDFARYECPVKDHKPRRPTVSEICDCEGDDGKHTNACAIWKRTVQPASEPLTSKEHLRCPFCNSPVDPEGWLDGYGHRGPECEGCGATAPSIEVWNTRAALPPPAGPLKLDNDRQVFFYEQDHYYLSNFSAFTLRMGGVTFPTSEHAYHFCKFPDFPGIQASIISAASAHEAFKLAEQEKSSRREDWDTVKVDIMRQILRKKAEQHEYVRRKLLQTGARELIENSWRDPYWGWGENRDGLNMLGKLWMEIRAELRASETKSGSDTVIAQHEETGRLWQGPRDQIPPRFTECAIEPPVETNEPLGHCCYGGMKPKSYCGSCAAWRGPARENERD